MASPPTHIAFLLHMHQPLYVNPASGRAEMPWVRLHGGRGYLDVARLLERHPSVSLTVNFVPSLVEQLERVVAGQSDAYLEVARRPSWTTEEREFLLGHFFSVNWGRAIEPRPRYRELLEKRGREPRPQELSERARAFSDAELRDLTVLFHLAWLGFAARAGEPDIARLEAKGRHFSLDDLETVLACGRAACASVLPLYRELASRGQVELSASPYYHPIVPLLCDSGTARRAMPHAALPSRFAFPEDARRQIARGRDAHARVFGEPPRGMWPPEGSVSPEAVAAYRDEQVGWLATDEGNLWRSLGGVRPRGELYRPYRHGGVDLVFRDRDLSDRIGFSYAFGDARGAVDDLLGRSRHAGSQARDGEAPPLVAIILDGENPWEAYPGSGEPFLQALFGTLEQASDLRAVSIGRYLASHPQRVELSELHSGSWIDSDFHIWIGDPVKNRAWELLGQARQRWQRAVDRQGANEKTERALEHLLAAEGSDWFWWFGEPFHSAEDATFDRLFRAHLAAAWSALGEATPPNLGSPVDRERPIPRVQPPRGLIAPLVDGRVGSYFEWVDSGRYDVPEGGAMAEAPVVKAVMFGCSSQALFLRFDPHEAARPRLPTTSLLVSLCSAGREVELVASLDGRAFALRARERERDGDPAPFQPIGSAGMLALQQILEASVPFAALGFGPGARLELTLQLHEGPVALGRFPRDGYLSLAVPDDNYLADHWSV